MAKPWVIVGGTGYDLEDVDNPRSREMECPSCARRVRFVEKDLVKNLKVFGVSLIGVEDGRRVFACPSCNTAVEPPEDAGLAPTDPKVVAIERKLARLREDADLWTRRADLAEKKGDDVLATDARGVAENNRREAKKLELELAALTAWDEDHEEKPTVVARVRSGNASANAGAGMDTEGPTLDRAFAALKTKLAGVASAVKGEVAREDDPPARSPLTSFEESEAAKKKQASLERAADDEFAALKAKVQKGALGAMDAARATGSVTAAAEGAERAAVDGGKAVGDPPDQSRGAEEYSRSMVSADELGGGLDYAPKPRGGASNPVAPAPVGPTGSGPAETPPDADDDPVAALKRKLKKPGPGV
jgi:hypothetical protein